MEITRKHPLDELLALPVLPTPVGFAKTWRAWREKALQTTPETTVVDTGLSRNGWKVFDLNYISTDGVKIGGWLLRPENGVVTRGLVVGHGYGGRDEPDFDLPVENAALLFLCSRGLSRSQHHDISHEPRWHVLHDIQDPEQYVLRGCVEDLWLAVSVLVNLFPQVNGHVGYIGSSFGGGVGAMALAWEDRVQRAFLHVPSFGNQPLRLQRPTIGSAASVQRFVGLNPGVAGRSLKLFDAAVSAKYMKQKVLCACALMDPVVTPLGQFSVYNSLAGEKDLFVLNAGHREYPAKAKQDAELSKKVGSLFADL